MDTVDIQNYSLAQGAKLKRSSPIVYPALKDKAHTCDIPSFEVHYAN